MYFLMSPLRTNFGQESSRTKTGVSGRRSVRIEACVRIKRIKEFCYENPSTMPPLRIKEWNMAHVTRPPHFNVPPVFISKSGEDLVLPLMTSWPIAVPKMKMSAYKAQLVRYDSVNMKSTERHLTKCITAMIKKMLHNFSSVSHDIIFFEYIILYTPPYLEIPGILFKYKRLIYTVIWQFKIWPTLFFFKHMLIKFFVLNIFHQNFCLIFFFVSLLRLAQCLFL